MHTVWNTNNRKMTLHLTIKCKSKKKFRLWAEDEGKRFSKYADRMIEVEGERKIFISLPLSPQRLFIGCKNIDNPNDKDFEVTIIESDLKVYNIWLDQETKNFLALAERFSMVCGYELPDQRGTIYQTDDAQFNIKYFPIIRDNMSGQPLNTPARIGHKSGIIEASGVKFIKYTIPMRMIILLHEYAHKYRNPKLNLEISNEVGADINALYIYLGLGFSKIDAICVFANVFLKAQTPENVKRMRAIMDFIQRFENEEYATVEKTHSWIW